MLFLFCSDFDEAGPLIKKMRLKKRREAFAFQQFADDRKEIIMTISGRDPIAVAACVGAVLAKEGAGCGDSLLSIGTALSCLGNGKEGKLWVLNKITDAYSGRCFYPDMICRSPFLEIDAKSGSSGRGSDFLKRERLQTGTVSEKEINSMEDGVSGLYDADSAAVFQAGSHFLAPHAMSFLRLAVESACIADDISGLEKDEGGAERKYIEAQVEAEENGRYDLKSEGLLCRQMLSHDIARMMEACAEDVLLYADCFAKSCRAAWPEYCEKQGADNENVGMTADDLAAGLHCSETMKSGLNQLLRFANVIGKDWRALVAGYKAEGAYPCRNKRDGKIIMEKLRKSLLK